MESILLQSRINIENLSSNPNPSSIFRDLHISKDKLESNLASNSITDINIGNQNDKSYSQHELDAISERDSNEKRDIISLLSQQQLENKRLAEQNQFLTSKLSNLLEQTNASAIQNHSYSIFNNSRISKEETPINRLPRKQFLNDSDAIRPHLDIKNVYKNLNRNEPREENMYYSPYGNHESTMTNQDVLLLQNHIVLLEKENELLKREICMAKQQESIYAAKIQEGDLRMLRFHEEVESVFRENQELKDLLKSTTNEANEKLLKLGDINSQYLAKLNNYQKVIEKLSNEIYSYSKISGMNSTRNDLTNNTAMKSYSESHYPQTDRTHKQDEGEIMSLRQENFQLRADIKALSELLSGSKDERILSEKKNVNYFENIQPFEVNHNPNLRSPLNIHKTYSQKLSDSVEIKKRSNSAKNIAKFEEISPIRSKNQNSIKPKDKYKQIIPQVPFKPIEK